MACEVPKESSYPREATDNIYTAIYSIDASIDARIGATNYAYYK